MSDRPRPTLAQMLAGGDLDRLFQQLGSWAAVAKHLGVNEATLRKVRRQARERLPDAWEKLGERYQTVAETRQVVLVDNYGGLSNSAEPTPESVGDFNDEEPTQPNIVIAEGTRPSWQPSDFRNPEVLPYEPPPAPLTRKLTRAECPDGTKILWASDVHIPIQNDPVCRLMVGCAERIGVTRVVAGGDILDFNCLSKHAKESRRTVEHATILEEVEPGRWLLDWFATKQTDYVLGNHEDRLKRFIDENPAFHGSVASNFANVTNLPAGINVIPQGGEVRIGSLSLRHLDAEFKNGTGGKYPANRILEMLPDQSTGGGHVHRIHQARRTTRDEYGISRTHAAWTFGHLSWEHMHYGYVSTSPNWQTGFAVITIEWEDDRPRFDVDPVEVLFDRYNRPYFFLWGEVYR